MHTIQSENFARTGQLKEKINKLQTVLIEQEGAAPSPAQTDNKNALRRKVETLSGTKDQTVQSEEFVRAGQLKEDVDNLQTVFERADREHGCTP